MGNPLDMSALPSPRSRLPCRLPALMGGGLAVEASEVSSCDYPKASKYQVKGWLGFSILGIVIVALGRYLIVGYLDP